jgi:hypothetical protein
VTKYRSSKLCLNELVLLHLKATDMQLNLIKVIPKLARIAPYTEALAIKLSHY